MKMVDNRRTYLVGDQGFICTFIAGLNTDISIG